MTLLLHSLNLIGPDLLQCRPLAIGRLHFLPTNLITLQPLELAPFNKIGDILIIKNTTGQIYTSHNISSVTEYYCRQIYQSALVEPRAREYISRVSWPPTTKDIPQPSHGRVFCEKFCSVFVVKGVQRLKE